MRRHQFLLLLFLASTLWISAQETPAEKWGPNDTILVKAIIVEGESFPYSELEPVYLTNGSHENMVKQIAAYNRLRNAVYVTYPYARTAGATTGSRSTCRGCGVRGSAATSCCSTCPATGWS